MDENVYKIDKTYEDLVKFSDSGEYDYAAMLTRTIVEIIVGTYTDAYNPYLKNLDPPPTIMDQIKALEETGRLPHDRIYNLHEMRKLGNIGSHKGKGSGDISIQVRSMIPVIESEISFWKAFVNGDQYLTEPDLTSKKQNSISYIVTLIVSIIGAVAIIAFSIRTEISFFRDGSYYDDAYLLQYWICIPTFLILAGFCRKYGIIQRLIFDSLCIYFFSPRVYLAILAMKSMRIFEFCIHLVIAGAIIAIYSVVSTATDQQNGGIVGYKGK